MLRADSTIAAVIAPGRPRPGGRGVGYLFGMGRLASRSSRPQQALHTIEYGISWRPLGAFR